MQPQLSQYEIDPSGALRMRSTSVEGIDRWHPWHVHADEPRHADASRMGPPPLVVGDQRRLELARDRVTRFALLGHLLVDRGLGGLERRAGAVDFVPERGALRVELDEVGVERLARLHQLELTVLEVALVPAQLVDVGLHRLELTRRRHRARVHLRLDLGRLLAQRARFVVEALLLVRDLVALPGEHADLRGERTERLLRRTRPSRVRGGSRGGGASGRARRRAPGASGATRARPRSSWRGRRGRRRGWRAARSRRGRWGRRRRVARSAVRGVTVTCGCGWGWKTGAGAPCPPSSLTLAPAGCRPVAAPVGQRDVAVPSSAPTMNALQIGPAVATEAGRELVGRCGCRTTPRSTSCGVPPRNHASLLLSVVPVLPKGSWPGTSRVAGPGAAGDHAPQHQLLALGDVLVEHPVAEADTVRLVDDRSRVVRAPSPSARSTAPGARRRWRWWPSPWPSRAAWPRCRRSRA